MLLVISRIVIVTSRIVIVILPLIVIVMIVTVVASMGLDTPVYMPCFRAALILVSKRGPERLDRGAAGWRIT